MKGWPDSSEGDDAQVHYDATTKLMESIQDIVQAIERVEGVLKRDEALYAALQDCPIPLDLLELLDHGNGLNPECFTRGLLREALGQLVGLRRRKIALEMLGTAIQNGISKRDASEQEESTQEKGIKRERDVDYETEDQGEKEDSEPSTKRLHTE
jgi:hypothetical protein